MVTITESQARYNKSPKGKARKRRYEQTPETRARESARLARRQYRNPLVERSPVCLDCGMAVTGQRLKFCSNRCAVRAGTRIAGDRERAAHAGVAFEPVYRWRVCERDNWTCQLCKLPVSWFLSWPHDWCAVLDHRMPLTLGGDHSYANVQLAHNTCNSWKATLGPAEFEHRLTEIGLGNWAAVVTGAAS
jgi:hypothetical protein